MKQSSQASTGVFERLTGRPSFILEARLEDETDRSVWHGRDYDEGWTIVGEVIFSDMRLWATERIGLRVEQMMHEGFHGYLDGRDWDVRVTELDRVYDGRVQTADEMEVEEVPATASESAPGEIVDVLRARRVEIVDTDGALRVAIGNVAAQAECPAAELNDEYGVGIRDGTGTHSVSLSCAGPMSGDSSRLRFRDGDTDCLELWSTYGEPNIAMNDDVNDLHWAVGSAQSWGKGEATRVDADAIAREERITSLERLSTEVLARLEEHLRSCPAGQAADSRQ